LCLWHKLTLERQFVVALCLGITKNPAKATSAYCEHEATSCTCRREESANWSNTLDFGQLYQKNQKKKSKIYRF